jgi:hypothetical protein
VARLAPVADGTSTHTATALDGKMGSVDEAANGFRAMRAMGAIALVALLALGFCASMARAEPLSMTFTEARANVGEEQLIDAALFEAPAVAPFAAQIDPGTGSITAGQLTVPDFSTFVTEPVDADLTVVFEIGEIEGSFDEETGALVGSGTAGGTLTANGKNCIVTTSPVTLILSTGGSSGGASPRSGVPFTEGLTGAGAVAGQWTDMRATPLTLDDTTVCNEVDEHISGPGGIWLEHAGHIAPPQVPTNPGGGDDDPAPAPAPACTVPKLVGKILARAKTALKAAHCKLGEVTKPKRAKGKKRRVLVVKSSSPRRGAKPADGKVDLKLHPKPKPKAKPKKTRR